MGFSGPAARGFLLSLLGHPGGRRPRRLYRPTHNDPSEVVFSIPLRYNTTVAREDGQLKAFWPSLYLAPFLTAGGAGCWGVSTAVCVGFLANFKTEGPQSALVLFIRGDGYRGRVLFDEKLARTGWIRIGAGRGGFPTCLFCLPTFEC